jgi:hypothetical protein
VLVTHDVNIRALVGASVNQGEMVVAARQPDGTLSVMGVVPVADALGNSLGQWGPTTKTPVEVDFCPPKLKTPTGAG